MRTSFLAALVFIGAVAAILPASSASFTDTVTSSENTFSTGSLPTPTLNATVEDDTAPGEIELTWAAGSPATNVQLQFSTDNTANCQSATGYANVPGSPFAAGASPEAHTNLSADDYCYRLRSYLGGTNWTSSWVYSGAHTIGTATPTDPEVDQLWLYSSGSDNQLVGAVDSGGVKRTVNQGSTVVWKSTGTFSGTGSAGDDWDFTWTLDEHNPARHFTVTVWSTTAASCGAAPANGYIARVESNFNSDGGGASGTKTEAVPLVTNGIGAWTGDLCFAIENTTTGGSGRDLTVYTDGSSYLERND